MKIKKIFFLLSLFLLPLSALFSPMRAASAESEVYACVTGENTGFYSSKGSSLLFILPQSYYVRVLAKGEEYSYVKYLDDYGGYKSVYGYCKTDELLFVDYVPLRPYLYHSFEAVYSLVGSDETSSDTGLSTITYTCRYYGYVNKDSSMLAYVYVNGSFGYIPLSLPVTYERNTDYLSSIAPPEEEVPSGESQADKSELPSAEQTSPGNSGTVIMIICLCLGIILVGGVIAVTLKNDRKKRFAYDEHGFNEN